MFSLARLLIHHQNYYLLTQNEELGDYLIDKDAEPAGPINIIRLLKWHARKYLIFSNKPKKVWGKTRNSLGQHLAMSLGSLMPVIQWMRMQHG